MNTPHLFFPSLNKNYAKTNINKIFPWSFIWNKAPFYVKVIINSGKWAIKKFTIKPQDIYAQSHKNYDWNSNFMCQTTDLCVSLYTTKPEPSHTFFNRNFSIYFPINFSDTFRSSSLSCSIQRQTISFLVYLNLEYISETKNKSI